MKTWKHWKIGMATVMLAGALGTGCTVEKTADGELPDVDVEGGKLPKYDVDTPDVDVSMKDARSRCPTSTCR
jgi:hypothetical protein